MPERPEMQALAERLEAALAGKTFERLDLHGFSALKTVSPGPETFAGEPLLEMSRRGKYVGFEFETGRILLHLSQGGRLDIEDPAKSTRPKGSVARLRFDGGTAVLIKEYGTERKAALWVLAPDDPGPLAVLGPEAESEAFAEWLMGTDDGRRIHTVLRDQRTVAGIGRGYADDICHRAMVSPYEKTGKLSAEVRARLLTAIREVLDEATDEERKRTGGLPAKLGTHFAIHNGHGRPCPRCGETMRRVSFESYEITYCPNCQTGGKVLADRRLSRLIK